jgi:DNA modification methylase
VNEILCGDVLQVLRTLPDNHVQCVVTSPPYWGLRDYGIEGQLGLEKTPEEYVSKMVAVFREVRRVLREDGTLWLNLGSSYAGSGKGGGRKNNHSKVESNPLASSAFACDNGGKGQLSCQEFDSVYSRLCGERQDGVYLSDKEHSDPQPEQASLRRAPKDRDSGQTDLGQAALGGASPCAQASTKPLKIGHAQDASGQEATASVCREARRSCVSETVESVHKLACTSGTQSSDRPLDGHKSDKVLLRMALDKSSKEPLALTLLYLTIKNLIVKPKDLIMMPHLVALALQADGWFLRSELIWAKLNPMPESVTDRPTKAHEQIFLLTKSANYYYDAEAIKEPVADSQVGRVRADIIGGNKGDEVHHSRGGCYHGSSFTKGKTAHGKHNLGLGPRFEDVSRNVRSVWSLASQAFSGAHFATFPEELPRRCILAGTSEKGACPKCGTPWERVVETVVATSKACPKTQAAHEARGGTGEPVGTVGKSGSGRIDGYTKTLGWQPGCECNAGEPVPCICLDPFMGSGTVAEVAAKLGRNWLGVELNPKYIELAKERLGVLALIKD